VNHNERQVQIADLESFFNRPSCPSCGSTSYRLLSEHTVFRLGEDFPSVRVRLGREVEELRKLYKCNLCELWYYSLVPTQEFTREVLSKSVLLGRWDESDRPTFQRGREAIKEFLPGKGNVLDIGAHTGGFLSTVMGGWRKFAVEPMIASSETTGDVTVFSTFLEDATLPESFFDCVSAFDVFEHLSSPKLAIGRIQQALRSNGLLIIETGDSRAFFARLLHAGWYYLNYLEHFQAFSVPSLEYLLGSHGFQILLCERVYRDRSRLNIAPSTFLLSFVYVCLTLGRQPRLWRFMSRCFRSRHNAAPPSTSALEPDHLFVVARKL
jgi:2-polyprenyl-3-methyl-5-hydroxy-6-metoxy-1,4-benzoquinol methylase